MKSFLVQFLTLVSSMTLSAAADSNPLEPFRWEHRIILVVAPTAEAGQLVANLKGEKEAIDERHILWFVIDETKFATNYSEPVGKKFRESLLKYHFEEFPGEIRVKLIGKDGGVKREAADLNLSTLYRLIDSMPMRQEEMRRN